MKKHEIRDGGKSGRAVAPSPGTSVSDHELIPQSIVWNSRGGSAVAVCRGARRLTAGIACSDAAPSSFCHAWHTTCSSVPGLTTKGRSS